ncbi:MAG TPA: GAF domain-containing protein, partial [Acidimicrobiales bacterium]|nr:GAF domain-containing protein [Acidimicrobiales bacterium]
MSLEPTTGLTAWSAEQLAGLLERLTKIQRSISLRAPLHELFDAITAGAAELLGDPIVSLYLVDPSDPDSLAPASIQGGPPDAAWEQARLTVGRGVCGQAVEEDRLVVVEQYR